MKFILTAIEPVTIVKPDVFSDGRGSFVKTFADDWFRERKIEFCPRESYYSLSKQLVIRGMHFQTGRDECSKLVYVTQGEIVDVILDIRPGSVTMGEYVEVVLSQKNKKAVFVPEGMAHGFAVLSKAATVVYSQSKVYSPANYAGIRWNSFGFKWPVSKPILSEKDRNLPTFADYKKRVLKRWK